MTEFLKDSSYVLLRIVTILPLTLFMTLYMGKRAIGELPVFDFLIILILGSVVGADIADPDIKHLPTAVAIVGIALIQRFVSHIKLTHRKLGRLITFEPTVVIQNGKFVINNLKNVGYSLDNILQMLREKDVFDVSEVEIALIEPAGTLSVLKKTEKQAVTLKDMKIKRGSSTLALPIIIEGKVEKGILSKFDRDETWLIQQLMRQQINDINEVFFASINSQLELHVSLKNEVDINPLEFKH